MGSNTILTSVEGGVRFIKFNRPDKRNAITREMYSTVTRILNEDASNDNIVVTILTGVGPYYSSGTDITGNDSEVDDDPFSDASLKARIKVVEDYVSAFISYPKILIAVINGPAIGIAVTSAALCDVVYASEKATFQTPFVKLSLCAEACSSYLLPRILGNSKANELLLLGRKMTAEEACKFGLVSEVVPHEKLDDLFKQLKEHGSLPVNSVKISKRLMRRNVEKVLCECNKRECTQLLDCFKSDDFKEAVIEFMSRKNKL